MITWWFQITDELLQTFFRIEYLLFELSFIIYSTTVCQCDFDTGVQVSKFAHAACQYLIFVDRFGKDRIVRPELLSGSGMFRYTYLLYRIKRFSYFILLLINLTVTVDLGNHVGRQCVYTRHTYTVQTTGNFIRTFVELTTGMKHCHCYFQCWFLFFFMEIYGDTASIVLYGDWIVFVDGYFNVVAITC